VFGNAAHPGAPLRERPRGLHADNPENVIAVVNAPEYCVWHDPEPAAQAQEPWLHPVRR
jgi:hypothetical protein